MQLIAGLLNETLKFCWLKSNDKDCINVYELNLNTVIFNYSILKTSFFQDLIFNGFTRNKCYVRKTFRQCCIN